MLERELCSSDLLSDKDQENLKLLEPLPRRNSDSTTSFQSCLQPGLPSVFLVPRANYRFN